MDIAEVEENFFAASKAKLHGEMCKILSGFYCKVLVIFSVLEAARPRRKSGIQALCSLRVVLENTKTVLRHCSECSKLYLAITGDSVLLRFEKARSALADSVRRVEDIVPQSIGCQTEEIVSELEGTQFSLDLSEKQVGDDIIALLQQGSTFYNNSNDMHQLESFYQAACRLGITSSRAALIERRALKKVIVRARMEDDKRKELIVAYLLHVMRKYSKLLTSEVSDDNDSKGSAPCFPTVAGSLDDGIGAGGDGHAFERHLSKHSSFNFTLNNQGSGQIPFPPKELRCPISLQLMHDPVIISSGQTYERLCIEKWFSDGHNTCPKTQHQLCHLGLTPNYCVKDLISSWCEQNGVSIPDAPPDSLDLNYWRLALSECESTNSKSVDTSIGSCKFKEMKVVPLEESGIIEEVKGNEVESVSTREEEVGLNLFKRYENFLLNAEVNVRKKSKVVVQILHLLRDDEEARIFRDDEASSSSGVSGGSSSGSKPRCQICDQIGHNALDCYHRIDYAYQGRHPPSQLVAMVASTNQELDENVCLSDSGANNHLIAELANLQISTEYDGDDTVAVGNGQGEENGENPVSRQEH